MIRTPMRSQAGQYIRAWCQQCKRHTALWMNARQRKPAMEEAAAAAAGETANRFTTPSRPPRPPAWNLADRSLSYDMKNPAYYFNPDNIDKVLISMSVLGWLAFGAICLLCINGHGRAGRWIPEWYLDSEGTRWDKVAVVAWWMAVVLGWPVILPCAAVKSLSGRVKRWRAGRRQKAEMEMEGERDGECEV